MEILIDSFRKSGDLHHAYCCEGDIDLAYDKLCKFLSDDVGVKVRGNPDFWYGKFDVFGIDDGRALNEMQEMRSLNGGKKVFVITMNSITHEAQNSLLKMFEEPTEETHFFILTRSSDVFLPTLRSRLLFIRCDHKEDDVLSDLVSKFLAKKPAFRLELLADIIEAKDKASAAKFLDVLIIRLSSEIKKDKITAKESFLFEEIMKCRSYLNDRSSAVKIILEHISNIIPVYK